MKKLFVVGIIILLISTTLASSIKTDVTVKPKSSDEPHLIVKLPDAYLNFSLSKLKWGVVEFDNPGAIIDVNLSGFEEEYPLVGFDQTAYINYNGQILPSLVIWTLDLSTVGVWVIGRRTWEFVGYGFEMKINRTFTCHYIRIDKSKEGYYPIKDILTGVPRRFSRLVFFMIVLDCMFGPLDKFGPLPFEKHHGEFVDYILHVHT